MAAIDSLTTQASLGNVLSPSLAAAGAEADPSRRPRSLPEAAEQFESLLIAELLRSAHGGDGGWLGSGEDSTSSPAIGMAEESLAQAISSHGGLGLSKCVVRSLSK